MTHKEAEANLQNLINAALKSGMFADTQAVFAVQESLKTLTAQAITAQTPQESNAQQFQTFENDVKRLVTQQTEDKAAKTVTEY